MGAKLAKTLSARLTLDVLPIGEDFSIIEIELNDKFANKKIQDLNFRAKFGINKANGYIMPDTILKEKDILVISGNNHDISAFEQQNAK
jgi:trk system potassium uptake protein TrkA